MKPLLAIFLIGILIGCQSGKNKESAPVPMDSTNLVADTTSVVTPASTEEPDLFEQSLKKVDDSLTAWGFTKKTEVILKDSSDLARHWWLQIFHRRVSEDRLKRLNIKRLPTKSDWNAIDSIRQVTYSRGWRFIIEEWTLSDVKAAETWLELAVSTKRLDDFKPPRVYWREGNKLYFIMAVAAKDWFEHGDELVKLYTGKSRWLIELLNAPLDLPEYKKEMRSANSGTSSGEKHFYKPNTVGTFYHYFWFHELRRQYGEQKARDAVEIETYKYGTEIGDYSDTNELFISLKARQKDRHLKRLDLVGTDRSQIIDQFGMGDQSKPQFISYFHNDYWLLLHFENEKVDWFEVTRVKSGFDPA